MSGFVNHPLEFAGLTFDVVRFLGIALRFALTYLLVLPIGRERERDDHSAGLRTFPMVAVASCGYVIMATGILGVAANGQANVIQGLITGIGFIGGGAIVKDQQRVRGTATAASLWATAAIGASVGYGQIELALTLALFTFATLRIYTWIEKNTLSSTTVDRT
jgi:putative Mg2+ transporter-C (MgtC) family protein